MDILKIKVGDFCLQEPYKHRILWKEKLKCYSLPLQKQQFQCVNIFSFPTVSRGRIFFSGTDRKIQGQTNDAKASQQKIRTFCSLWSPLKASATFKHLLLIPSMFPHLFQLTDAQPPSSRLECQTRFPLLRNAYLQTTKQHLVSHIWRCLEVLS